MHFNKIMFFVIFLISHFSFTEQAAAVLIEVTEGRNVGGFLKIPPRLSMYAGENHYKNHEGLSKIYYTNNAYPKVPLLHPYDPENPKQERIDLGIASIPLTIHIPANACSVLPEAIKREININSVGENCVKIFFVAQNFPWTSETIPSFRPQYATDPNATEFNYNKKRTLRTGVFNSGKGCVFFRGKQPNELLTIDLSAHPNEPEKRTVLSGDQPYVHGLSPAKGSSFWSYVGYKDDLDGNKYKIIATLHWILNDEQQNVLSKQIQSNPTLSGIKALLNDLKNTKSFSENGELIKKAIPLWKKIFDPECLLNAAQKAYANKDFKACETHIEEYYNTFLLPQVKNISEYHAKASAWQSYQTLKMAAPDEDFMNPRALLLKLTNKKIADLVLPEENPLGRAKKAYANKDFKAYETHIEEYYNTFLLPQVKNISEYHAKASAWQSYQTLKMAAPDEDFMNPRALLLKLTNKKIADLVLPEENPLGRAQKAYDNDDLEACETHIEEYYNTFLLPQVKNISEYHAKASAWQSYQTLKTAAPDEDFMNPRALLLKLTNKKIADLVVY